MNDWHKTYKINIRWIFPPINCFFYDQNFSFSVFQVFERKKAVIDYIDKTKGCIPVWKQGELEVHG